MKTFIIILVFVATAIAQCIIHDGDCNACKSTTGCNYCSYNGGLLHECQQACTEGGTLASSCLTSTDIRTHSDFLCVSNTSASLSYSGYAAYQFSETTSPPNLDVTAQAIAYYGIGAANKPALLGFSFLNVGADLGPSSSFSVDVFGAFHALLSVFEFIPTASSGAYTADATIVGTPVNFTGAVVTGCSNVTSGSTVIYSLTFTYPSQPGWSVVCRISADPTTDANGNPISPGQGKCDLTFGQFTFSGQQNTRLAIKTAFIIGSISANAHPVTSTSTDGVMTCPKTDGICLFSKNSNFAGQFVWVKATNNSHDVVASGVTAYTGSTSDFYIPPNPYSQKLANVTSGVTGDVNIIASVSVVFFSFPNTVTPGEVWDPTLSIVDKSSVDSISGSYSTTSFINSSLLLFAATMLLKFFL